MHKNHHTSAMSLAEKQKFSTTESLQLLLILFFQHENVVAFWKKQKQKAAYCSIDAKQ